MQHRALFMLGLFALLVLPLPAESQERPVGDPVQTLAEPTSEFVSLDQIELARLGGRVDALTSQLETERALTEKVLGTVQTVVTVYTAAVAVIAFLLGVLGYLNLRAHLEREVEARVKDTLEKVVDQRVAPAIKRKELEWDRKFDTLYRRIERVAPSGN